MRDSVSPLNVNNIQAIADAQAHRRQRQEKKSALSSLNQPAQGVLAQSAWNPFASPARFLPSA